MKEPTQDNTNDYCGNCQHSVGDAKFCSNCGQKNTDGRISFKDFISVVFATIFNLESKFFQTIRDIFIPGKLTNEWFKGRHKPYFHPVRLFIVTALMLIATLTLFTTEGNSYMVGSYEKAQEETYRKTFIKEIENYKAIYLRNIEEKSVIDTLAKTMRERKIDSGRKTMANYGKKKGVPAFQDKSPEEMIAYYTNEFGVELTDSLINVIKSQKRLNQDSVQLITLVGDGAKRKISNEDFLDLTPNEVADKYHIEGFFKRIDFKQRIRLQKSSKNLFPFVLGNSLWVALLMMPFLAFILRLLYLKRNYYYVEHLIFSFHAHSFAFILFTGICIFMKLIVVHPFIVFFGFLMLFIYLYKSMRKVYKQSRTRTILKLIIANVVYVVLFLAFALLGFIVSVFIF